MREEVSDDVILAVREEVREEVKEEVKEEVISGVSWATSAARIVLRISVRGEKEKGIIKNRGGDKVENMEAVICGFKA